jgi:choline dehydrogenase-like flavoprotein
MTNIRGGLGAHGYRRQCISYSQPSTLKLAECANSSLLYTSNPVNMTTDILEEADIVIIGAGTAGCVLANRLSADPSLSVLVLEAGEDHSKDARVYTPARARELHGDKHLDWAFESEPEAGLYHLGLVGYDESVSVAPGETGRTMSHPRGKAVGGSTVINSFAIVNPSAKEIDAWAELGNEGWDWAGMKKYFRKFQTVKPPAANVVEELSLAHNFTSDGGSGPIQATFPVTVTALQKAWLDAFRSLDLENLKDPLEGQAIGGGITTNHIGAERRERCHAGVAYLTPVEDRKNLRIVTGAMVQRIQFEKEDSSGKAVGRHVTYEKGGETRQVRVRKEVILAAGVFGTPQMLELSGIGDVGLLREHGIKVIYDNPAVGENLQDHIRAGVSFEGTQAASGGHPPMSTEEAEQLYINSRSGPWAEMACYTFAYMPLAGLSSATEMQQLEATYREHIDSRSQGMSAAQRKYYDFIEREMFSPTEATATAHIARKNVTPVPGPELETGNLTFYAMLSHPLSRGSVHIKSSGADTKPAVAFNYYRNSLDLEVHARHMINLQALAQNSAFAPMIKRNGAQYPLPLDVAAAKVFLKRTATTNYHPCGTCAMMPEQNGGVVDTKLKVYGTTNVRVVDASVFPIIPRGNIVSTVYAVAERAADILWEDLGLRLGNVEN